MENNKKDDTEQKSREQLFSELLESINRQSEVNVKLREILEQAVTASSQKGGADLTEETVTEIRVAIIEAHH